MRPWASSSPGLMRSQSFPRPLRVLPAMPRPERRPYRALRNGGRSVEEEELTVLEHTPLRARALISPVHSDPHGGARLLGFDKAVTFRVAGERLKSAFPISSSRPPATRGRT